MLEVLVDIIGVIAAIAVPLVGWVIGSGIRKFNKAVANLSGEMKRLNDSILNLEMLYKTEQEKRKALQQEIADIRGDIKRLDDNQQELRKYQFDIMKDKFNSGR